MAETPEQLAASLTREARAAGDLSPLLRLFAVAARADTAENFQRSVTPDDVPWLPLKHPRPRGGTLPLLDTGILRAAAISPGPHHVERYGPSWLEYGVRLAYAAVHQFGAVIVPKLAKWLAIPRTREAQRAGSPRNFGPRLAPIFGPVGGVLKDDQGVVQYALTKRVVVPARPFLGLGPRLVRKLQGVAADWLRRRALGRPEGR